MTEIESSQTSSQLVPLAKYELVLGGCSNVAIVILGFVFESWIDLTIGFDHSAITTVSELNEFGVYVQSTRNAETIQLGVMLFFVPLFLFWYIAMMRVLTVCFVEYNASRIVFSVCYIIYVVFIYMGESVGIVWQAFNWKKK
eukprot:372847_1